MKSCASLAPEKSVIRNENDSQSRNVSIIILICNTPDHPCCDEPTCRGKTKQHINYELSLLLVGLRDQKQSSLKDL